MNRSQNSHSRMFLTELIIAILFFSLSSAVCLRMFAASRRINRDTAVLDMSVNLTGNAAELLKHAQTTDDAFPDCVLEEYPYAEAGASGVTIYFDESWNHCKQENSAYFLEIARQEETDGIVPYRMELHRTAEEADVIYSLDMKLHTPVHP